MWRQGHRRKRKNPERKGVKEERKGLNQEVTRYTMRGLPLRRNYVCPAFNPPDIQSFLRAFLRVLCDFVVQKRERLPSAAGGFSFSLSSGKGEKKEHPVNPARPVKQPTGLPDADRGFTGVNPVCPAPCNTKSIALG